MVSAGPVDKPFRVYLTQSWVRFDGSHDDDTPVRNRHVVSLDFWRTELAIAYAFKADWDLELQVPYEVKRVRASYELPDGTPYDNPEGNLHHRDETLEGFSDFRLYAVYRTSGGEGRHRTFLGLGTSLPTGETQENPFELGLQGIRHQHIQFGDGTFDPLLKAGYTYETETWGWDVSGGGRFPLYSNRHAYQGPVELDFSLGPRWKFAERVSLGLHYSGIYQERARWDSATDPNSGYFLQGIQASLPIKVGGSVFLVPSVFQTLSVSTRGEGDTFKMGTMFSLTLARAF